MTRICSLPECGKPNEARGYCGNHYRRLRIHGDPLGGGPDRASPGEPQKFYEDIILPYDGDDCLIWPYNRDTNGYAQMHVAVKKVTVSRKLCEDVNGPPTTPEHDAAHSCGNGHLGCVTKRHLSWKTKKENQADKLSHGTHQRGERSHLAKLTEAQAREILSLRGKEIQRATATRFGVSTSAIGAIQNGRIWTCLDRSGGGQ
jgi:hypothetical protein